MSDVQTGSTRPQRQVMAVATAAFCLGAVIIACSASNASALLSASCTGIQSFAFRPGITTTPQISTVHGEAQLACPPLGVVNVGIASVRVEDTVQSEVSCLVPASGAVGLQRSTLTWSTGETSTFEWTLAVVNVGGVAVLARQGAIAAGKYRGSSALQPFAEFGNPVACLEPPGITQTTDATSLTIF